MAATPYAGHAPTSASKLAATTPDDVAPADRPTYNPNDAAWANVPGRAAREGGHPRADGRGDRFALQARTRG